MRLVSFLHGGRERFGASADGAIADLTDRFGHATLGAVLRDEGIGRVREVAKDVPRTLAVAEVQLLPPITDPGRIVCVGLNYRTHIAESGLPPPAAPMLFSRYPDSLVGHRAALVRPTVSQQFDFEGELAVVIGERARHVSREDALSCVAGYACFNDGSVRDYQLHTSQFLAGKTFWRSGSFGPWIVTSDELPDLPSSRLTTRLNGVVMQDPSLGDLLFDVPELVSYLSAIAPLMPGDVIATGTTGGVGFARDPQVWMKPGDTVEIEISGIGSLSNSVVDERDLAASLTGAAA